MTKVVKISDDQWVAADDAGWTDEVYTTEEEARAAMSIHDPQPRAGCPAAINIKGEHFPCDKRLDEDGTHWGPHTSVAAEAIWRCSDEDR